MSVKKPLWKSSVFQTFAAMILGAILGLVLGDTMSSFKFIGDIWLNCLKMILVPLIFCTMTLAIGTQSNLKTLGRIALRLFLYYMLTTALASGVGFAVASVIRPGRGMSLLPQKFLLPAVLLFPLSFPDCFPAVCLPVFQMAT